MWELYRRRFWITQTFILVLSAIHWFYSRRWESVAISFAFMQVMSVVGTAWGARLQSKIEAQRQDLPLNRK